MKNSNYMYRVISALILCAGVLLSGCSKEPDPIAVTAVELDKSVLELVEGESATLTITFNPDNATNKVVSWTTSDESVASVKDGVVTAVKSGSAIITATSDEGGYTATCDVTVRSDLSSSSSANCYIVSQSGFYSFKAVKGNSSDSVGEVSSVEALWESFGTDETPSVGDLVKNITYKDGCIAFEATDRKGNAVIAAKDAGGKILWSWHIWLTDEPQVQEYKNNAGIMMDRNLGATSAIPGEASALGLHYQWGRKDPFLSSSAIMIQPNTYSSVVAASTITWPKSVKSTSETGTIDFVTANPTTFVSYNYKNFDWYYSDESGMTDPTRWQSSKTIYDPCPPGWRVPDGGDDGVWAKAGFEEGIYDSILKGISFNISSPATAWYPATGQYPGGTGGLYNTGNFAGYWSVDPSGDKVGVSLMFNANGHLFTTYSDSCAYGFAVRCLKMID